MSRKISVSFDVEQVRKMVDGIIVQDVRSRKDVIDFFTSMVLENYSAGEPFVLMITGSLPDQIYYRGDIVQVSEDSMYVSNVDKEASKQKNYLDGGYYWGVIKEFRKTKTDCYNVQITFIGTKGPNDVRTGEYWVPPSAIRKENVLPSKDRMNFGDVL
jgi:hypothetical protein